MKRIDIVIDTDLNEDDILNIINYELGEIILYAIEDLKAKDKESVIKELIGL